MPTVEPEVLMEGNHTFARCEAVMGPTLQMVFAALAVQRVTLEGMLLQTAMVLPGRDSPRPADPAALADATLRGLRHSGPPAVPGIVFLSGGQSDVAATERLNAICAAGGAPWRLTFSYGRALQDAALKTWAGSPANVAAAQSALLHRARCHSLAVQGNYSAAEENASA